MAGARNDSERQVGIISAVESNEDKQNITAVTDMIKQHIQGNTLILLTITMRGTSGTWNADSASDTCLDLR